MVERDGAYFLARYLTCGSIAAIKWLYILRNGLWAACIAFVVLATILLIRYRTVHRRTAGRDAREDPNGGILGELGADDDDALLRGGPGGLGIGEVPDESNQGNPFGP